VTGERAAQRLGVTLRSLVADIRAAESPNRTATDNHYPPGVNAVVDAISVDLEDYFHVEAFAAQISRSRWGMLPSRVIVNTMRTLEVLDRARCRATFFVLGWVAEREPGLIHELVKAGHEVACHSHLHRPLHTLRPSEFRDDLICSRNAIESAAGAKVVGFRAPTFSITKKSLWALEILAEEGFRYDSSIFPIHHDLYGMPSAPRWPHRRGLHSGQEIWEIPPSTVRMGKMNIPFGGGGYLRLMPMSFTRWAIHRTHRRDNQPVVVYFHPWELDPDQPRLAGSWRSRLRHYTGLRKTANRLDEILSRGNFQPLINLVRRLESESRPMADATDVLRVPWFEGDVAAPPESVATGVSLKVGQSA
jgi:polysaccharide deacetylase family protein (PEP-CTERM system associated)